MVNHIDVPVEVACGRFGENTFAQLLNSWEILYIRFDQAFDTKPLILTKANAKRLDFILPAGTALTPQKNIYIDVKNYRLNDSNREFILKHEELERLLNCKESFGTDEIHVAFHDNRFNLPTFYFGSIDKLNQLKRPIDYSEFYGIGIDQLLSVTTLTDLDFYLNHFGNSGQPMDTVIYSESYSSGTFF